jgi:tetratricopeptide (TPR) repeat protein
MRHTILLLLAIFYFGYASAQSTIDQEKLLDLYETQRYSDAAEYLESTYGQDSVGPKALSQLAYAYKMAGKLPKAEESYLKLRELDSTNLPVLFNLAEINSRRGNATSAKRYYLEILKLDTANFNVFKQLAELSKYEPEITRLKYLQKANELNNTDADVAFDLAEMYFKSNLFDKASGVLAPALAADSANLQLLKMKMPISLATKKYNEAIETGNKLLSYGDSSTFVLNNLGKSYYLTLDYQNALKSFLAIKRNSGDNEALNFNIARSYRGVKDYKNAVVYLQKTIGEAVSPSVASYYGLLGDSFENIDKNEDATKAYKKGLDFENDGSLLYNIALVYETKLNDKKNAISYYEQYLKTVDKTKQAKLVRYINTKIEELKR